MLWDTWNKNSPDLLTVHLKLLVDLNIPGRFCHNTGETDFFPERDNTEINKEQ